MTRKLFTSIVSLFLSICLCVVTVYAWFTNNKQVEATGISGTVISNDCEIKLFELNNKTWVELSSLNLSYIEPGVARYFKMEVTNASKNGIRCSYSNVTTSLSDQVELKAKDDISYVCLKTSEIELYKFNSDGIVFGETSKVLYKLKNDETIELQDYKIENIIKTYIFTADDFKDLSSLPTTFENDKSFNENIFTATSTELNNGSYICYFALYYPEDNTNSYYSYQKLNIEHIVVQAL